MTAQSPGRAPANPAWEGHADCRRCPIRDRVLFAGVPDERLEQTLVPITNLRFGAKAIVYAAGDPGRFVYSLRRGAVKLMQTLLDGESRVVRVLRPGDVLGLEALLDRAYAHTAIALCGLDICRIPIEIVHKLNAGLHPLHTELLQRWQRHLDMADEFITEFSTGPSQRRVARLLLLLDESAGPLHGTPLSREDMGQILGMTTETASRILAGFKRRNIFREENGLVRQIDLAALREIADGD